MSEEAEQLSEAWKRKQSGIAAVQFSKLLIAFIWDWRKLWKGGRENMEHNRETVMGFSPAIFTSVTSGLLIWKNNVYFDPSSLNVLTPINKTAPFKCDQTSGGKKRNILTTLRDHPKIKPQGQDYQPEIFL